MSRAQPDPLNARQIGPVTILFGKDMGKYPEGNSVLVRGERETVLVDPSLGIIPRQSSLPPVHRLLFSHVHEDHLASAYLFPDAVWTAHEEDLQGLRSLAGFMDIYGMDPDAADRFAVTLVEQFNYMANPDAQGFSNGERFDLGGVWIEVVHTPGHTRGHSALLIEWAGSRDRLLYLGDIDLTGFGPYYGDAWSDLEDFERSLALVETIDANLWLTFHHKGLYEDREAFLADLAKYADMIRQREERLLDYLAEPRTMEEIVAHRFVYRPHNQAVFIDSVERRSMQHHLNRLERDGKVTRTAHEQFVTTGGAA